MSSRVVLSPLIQRVMRVLRVLRVIRVILERVIWREKGSLIILIRLIELGVDIMVIKTG